MNLECDAIEMKGVNDFPSFFKSWGETWWTLYGNRELKKLGLKDSPELREFLRQLALSATTSAIDWSLTQPPKKLLTMLNSFHNEKTTTE